MQVDPEKPKLKSPGIKRSKLKYDEPLSNFAFNFNLRRYNEVDTEVSATLGAMISGPSEDGIPAHVRATAHNIPGSAAASDDEEEHGIELEQPQQDRFSSFSFFGSEIGFVPATAVASFAALALVAAALVRRRRTRQGSAG